MVVWVAKVVRVAQAAALVAQAAMQVAQAVPQARAAMPVVPAATDARSVAATTILLSVAYQGTRYSGAATQQNAMTVADTLRKGLLKLEPSVSALRLVSRTDAGVHARDQRVAFETQAQLPMRAWVLGMLPYLPNDIVVRSAARVRTGFIPRFAARYKHYRYLLYGDRLRDPFMRDRAWRIPDIQHAQAAIHQALQHAQGTHDFSGFAAAADIRDSKECTLFSLSCSRVGEDGGQLHIDIRGDRFVYNMVRIVVGTAVDVGRERKPPDAIATTLKSRLREDGGVTAPAYGLYLQRVALDVEILDEWPPLSQSDPSQGYSEVVFGAP